MSDESLRWLDKLTSAYGAAPIKWVETERMGRKMETAVELKSEKSEPKKLVSVHDIIGFDDGLAEVWQGLAIVGQMLTALGTAVQTPKTNRGSNGRNARMVKGMNKPALRAVRASVEALQHWNANGKPKPGEEALIARQRAALAKLIERIDAVLAQMD